MFEFLSRLFSKQKKKEVKPRRKVEPTTFRLASGEIVEMSAPSTPLVEKLLECEEKGITYQDPLLLSLGIVLPDLDDKDRPPLTLHDFDDGWDDDERDDAYDWDDRDYDTSGDDDIEPWHNDSGGPADTHPTEADTFDHELHEKQMGDDEYMDFRW